MREICFRACLAQGGEQERPEQWSAKERNKRKERKMRMKTSRRKREPEKDREEIVKWNQRETGEKSVRKKGEKEAREEEKEGREEKSRGEGGSERATDQKHQTPPSKG